MTTARLSALVPLRDRGPELSPTKLLARSISLPRDLCIRDQLLPSHRVCTCAGSPLSWSTATARLCVSALDRLAITVGSVGVRFKG